MKRTPHGFPPELAIATKNPGKIRELLQICADWPVAWVTREEPGRRGSWPDVEETGESYLDNALLKARATVDALGLSALADDSGIEVDLLGGAPGPKSARFAGDGASDEDNLRLLIERIRDAPSDDRTARYRCVAACAWPDGAEVSAEAVCEGRLILEPRGAGGFGYDPMFVPDEQQPGEPRTMAEFEPGEKNLISHRGKAFRALRARLAG